MSFIENEIIITPLISLLILVIFLLAIQIFHLYMYINGTTSISIMRT